MTSQFEEIRLPSLPCHKFRAHLHNLKKGNEQDELGAEHKDAAEDKAGLVA